MRKSVAVLALSIAIFSTNILKVSAQSSIVPATKLRIDLGDLDSVVFYFSESSFDSYMDAAELRSDGNKLVSGDRSIPLIKAKRLLASLHDMYPSPEALTVLRWTDDYPYEQVTIKLKDGRQIVAISSSQFPKGVPWNIRVWQGDPNKGGELIGSYVLLNYDFHGGASEIWEALTGEGFPRSYELDQFFWSEEEKTPTVEFYVPRPRDGFTSYGEEIAVQGREPEVALAPFVPLLKRNSELSQLFGAGYTLFDAAFNLTVKVDGLSPVSYSGMIALKAPDSADVMVSTATIRVANPIEVTSPLTIQKVEAEIAKRESFFHLEYLTDFIPGLVFIHELRNAETDNFVDLECPQDKQYANYDYGIQALLTGNNNQTLNFYHLPQKRAWTIHGGFYRENGSWNDRLVENALQKWFPASLADLSPEDMELLSLDAGVAFRPNITQQKPELIAVLQNTFPTQGTLHIAHPQKDGDKTFAQLEGEIVIPEDKSDPKIVYCDHERPNWYGPDYRVDEVKAPDPSGSRFDLPLSRELKEGWTPLFLLPDSSVEVTNSTFVSSAPGYLHFLWTIDKKGVYYSEGWADGTGWLKPQRLGDDSWTLQTASNTSGEIHLLWSTHFDPIGTMHVWRNSKGEWQKPEYWEGIGYFSNILLDEQGNLHLAWSESDGWDREFFYAQWTNGKGISQPENVSRRLGDLGNISIILRLDSQERIHAVWGHPLSGQQYVDPLSGEAFDTAGLFYSERLGTGNWTLPEQIGTFAPFTGAMGFELTGDDTPVVVWQSTDGIVSSMRTNQRWSSLQTLQDVVAPEEPDPFGPGRWVEPTAEIRLLKDDSGQLQVIWNNGMQGIFLSHYAGQSWSGPEQIMAGKELSNISAGIDPSGAVNLLYFDSGGQLYLLNYANHESVKTHLSMAYDMYGNESAQLQTDNAGFIYVLGLPRTPHWRAFIPSLGISLIPTPLPLSSASPMPSRTATPTSTPVFTTTPTASLTPIVEQIDSRSFFMVSISVVLLSAILLAVLIRFRGKNPTYK